LSIKEVKVNSCDETGKTALHCATERGHFDIVQELLSNKEVKVNSCDETGKTALHCAAEKGHLDIVKCLVGKGANVQARTIHGMTPGCYSI
jgi:ankyrin repeat protein